MSEGQRPLYSFITIPWVFIKDSRVTSSSFFLLISAGVLLHVKKIKPDLDVHFQISLPEQQLLDWDLKAWAQCIELRGTEIEPKTAFWTQLRLKPSEPSRRGSCLKWLLKAGLGAKLQDTMQTQSMS